MAIDRPDVRRASIVRFRPGVVLTEDLHAELYTVVTHPKAIVSGNHEMIVVDIMSSQGCFHQVPVSTLEVATQEN